MSLNNDIFLDMLQDYYMVTDVMATISVRPSSPIMMTFNVISVKRYTVISLLKYMYPETEI